MFTHTCTHLCKFTHTFGCIHAQPVYTWMYTTHVHTCTHTCIYSQTPMFMHRHTCAHRYSPTHTRVAPRPRPPSRGMISKHVCICTCMGLYIPAHVCAQVCNSFVQVCMHACLRMGVHAHTCATGSPARLRRGWLAGALPPPPNSHGERVGEGVLRSREPPGAALLQCTLGRLAHEAPVCVGNDWPSPAQKGLGRPMPHPAHKRPCSQPHQRCLPQFPQLRMTSRRGESHLGQGGIGGGGQGCPPPVSGLSPSLRRCPPAPAGGTTAATPRPKDDGEAERRSLGRAPQPPRACPAQPPRQLSRPLAALPPGQPRGVPPAAPRCARHQPGAQQAPPAAARAHHRAHGPASPAPPAAALSRGAATAAPAATPVPSPPLPQQVSADPGGTVGRSFLTPPQLAPPSPPISTHPQRLHRPRGDVQPLPQQPPQAPTLHPL